MKRSDQTNASQSVNPSQSDRVPEMSRRWTFGSVIALIRHKGSYYAIHFNPKLDSHRPLKYSVKLVCLWPKDSNLFVFILARRRFRWIFHLARSEWATRQWHKGNMWVVVECYTMCNVTSVLLSFPLKTRSTSAQVPPIWDTKTYPRHRRQLKTSLGTESDWQFI